MHFPTDLGLQVLLMQTNKYNWSSWFEFTQHYALLKYIVSVEHQSKITNWIKLGHLNNSQNFACRHILILKTRPVLQY